MTDNGPVVGIRWLTTDLPDSTRNVTGKYVHSCTTCGVQFGANRPDAVYCSPACRQQAYRDRQALNTLLWMQDMGVHVRFDGTGPDTEGETA